MSKQQGKDKIEEYLNKHDFLRRWLAVMLVMALLVASVTLYAMNKGASAVSQEGAEDVGMILNVSSDEELFDSNGEAVFENPKEDNEVQFEENSSEENSEENNADSEGTTESDGNTESGEESSDSVADNTDNQADTENAEQTSGDGTEGNNNTENPEEPTGDTSDTENTENAKDDENTEKPEDGKIAEADIPESVDLSEYVTETVIERLTEDGTWETIAESDIKEGDHLRVTMKYSMPEEASLSDDIHMDVPEQYGNVISTQSDLDDGNGTFEATDNNQIIINYSDEYKKEKISEGSESGGNDKTSEGTDSKEGTADSIGTPDDSAKVKTSGSSKSALFAFLDSAIDLFDGFTIVAHAAGNATGSLTYETIVDSTDGGGMIITNVTVKKNPTEAYVNGNKTYAGGTEIYSGSEINQGEGFIFTLQYKLEIGTVSKENPSITYSLTKHGITVEQAVDGKVYNGNNKEVGIFKIDEEGLVTITFHDEFAEKNRTNVIDDSSFFFYAVAKGDKGKEKTEKKYDFGNDVKFEMVVVNKKAHDLDLKKKVLEDYNAETGLIKYEITMKTENGTETDIQFKDWLEVYNNTQTNKSLSQELTSSITWENILDQTITKVKSDNSTERVDRISGNGIDNMTLAKLEEGESYIITYTLKVPEAIKSTTNAIILKNNAQAIFKEKNKKEASCSSDFYGTIPQISKDGNVKEGERTVNWKITLNAGHSNLKGYTLTDLMHKFADNGWEEISFPYTGEMKVDSVELANGQSSGTLKKGSKIILGENGYTFTEDDYSKYVFRYSCKYSDTDIMYGKLKNEARIYLSDNVTGNTSVREKEVKQHDPLYKTAEGVSVNDDGTTSLTWKVTLNAPILRNAGNNNEEYWVFYEYIEDNNQVFTSKDVENLKKAIKNVYSGKFDVSTSDSAKAGKVSGVKSIEIKFYQDIESTVSFEYTTTGSAGDGKSSVQYANKAAVYNKNVYGRTAYQSYEPFIRKYDGNNIEAETTYDYNTDSTYKQGILTWIIEANIPKNNNYGTLHVIDDLPSVLSVIENGTYNDKSLYGLEVCENNSFNGAVGFSGNEANYNGVTYTRSGDANRIVISFDAKAAAGKRVYFRVHAKIPSSYNFSTEGGDRFTNTAVLSKDSDGSEKLGEASQTQKITKTDYALTKKGQLATGGRNTIEYELDVNPSGADLLEAGDTLKLTDVLEAKSGGDYTVYLLPDATVVYEVTTNENGEAVERQLSGTEYSYTLSTYETTAARYNNGGNDLKAVYSTIVFKIPDEKHLKIRYSYTFNGNMGTTVELSNDAKLEGISMTHDSASSSTMVTINNAGATANVRGINVYKVDAENSGILLPGAVFSLYYFDGSTWVPYVNEKTADGKFTTDSDGLATIAPLVYNVAYKLVEEQAPQGYTKDDTPVCFYIPSADIEHYPMVLPSDFFTALRGSEYTAGQPVYVANKKSSTSISIKKEWVNADYTKPTSISVRVGRRLGNATSGKGSDSLGTYYTVNIDRRNSQNSLLQYVGFPSVKSGTQLTFTFWTFNEQYWGDLSEVTINGEKLDYRGDLNTSGIQPITKTITITQDTTIVIKDSGKISGSPRATLTASVSAPNENLNTANAVKGEGGATVGAQDLGFDKEMVITEVDGWKATMNGLDRFYTDKSTGITYEWLYYVSEVASLYYEASYSDNNSPGINSGTITITNTRNEVQSYALPSTGGSGKLPFTIGGLAFITASLIGMGYTKRKRLRKK